MNAMPNTNNVPNATARTYKFPAAAAIAEAAAANLGAGAADPEAYYAEKDAREAAYLNSVNGGGAGGSDPAIAARVKKAILNGTPPE